MKVLCICPIGIGNYLMVYPACRSLKQNRPDLRLHLLALRSPIAGIARGDQLWERVHTIDPTRESSVMRRIMFVNELRRERYDASLSLFPSNKWQYNFLPVLWNIPERFAFSYPLNRIKSLGFLNNRQLPIDASLHDVHQNARMAGFFLNRDIDAEPQSFPALFGTDEQEFAEHFFAETGARQMKIAIHPGSSAEHGMDCKRWEPEKFGLLADSISSAFDGETFVFGSADETPLKEAVKRAMKTPCQCVDPVELRRTAALVSTCSVMLCNDSGLMHMASCMDVPTVAVFGPTDERRNGPMGKRSIVLRKEMPHFPLWTARTVGKRTVARGIDPMASLKALGVDDAWRQVEPWLRRVIQ